MRLYRRYNWVGNRIKHDDMAAMHKIKQEKRIPITQQVAEAVKEYVIKKKGTV